MDLTNPFDANIKLLSKVLDLRSENQRVISSNIANAETPGYSPAKFNFEQDLKNALQHTGSIHMETTHAKHINLSPVNIDQVKGNITRHPDNTGIGDENGVSVDSEMIALSKNQLMYEATAQLLKKKISAIKYAVSDGK